MKILCSLPVRKEQREQVRSILSEANFLGVKDFSQVDQDVEVLVSFGHDISEETLFHFPRLRWIQVMSSGIDHLPLQAMAGRGIALTNARGAHQIQMSEHILWSILTIMRQGQISIHHQERKVWDPEVRIDELYDKTVCIIGAGSIGEAVAKKCRAFGMTVWGITHSVKNHQAYDRIGMSHDLNAFLAKSDIVVVIVPLTSQTFGMFNKNLISQMKTGSYLVNVARGAVMDESALVEALKTGKIRAAALDVFVQEPLPESSPFWEMKNVLLTPHIAGRSPHYVARTFELFKKNLKVYPDFSQMTNHIDISRGY
ncbi:D-2-hydroxyacid dehydrogenase [Desulfosporosinus fructosivorans]|uniref:D-2-hydroxyacid dehydrogenase n=1 Tax=Desulfosporosinus fructosivorans TaxID=2018669 RepID=A0A4Z0R901_9FIRM|nr:D-2-hydroxyacid dehydrogenase [Desulfosporosinus fructosivorans]TGE38925.1 D-2-hydroxyacid dehydrogenase [Desulfosporosinus fructosivorans]